MDPPPHRERQRVFGALLGARGRVLRAGAGARRQPGEQQPAGPRPGARSPRGRGRAGHDARRTPSGPTPTTSRCSTRTQAGAPVEPERAGLARELARIVLPLNTYTEWYWKTDLHNLLHFIALRADAHAQYEIRAYALVLLDVVRRWVPLTCAAFEDYRLNAAELSGKALAVLRRMLAGEDVSQADSGLSAREWRELHAHLNGA